APGSSGCSLEEEVAAADEAVVAVEATDGNFARDAPTVLNVRKWKGKRERLQPRSCQRYPLAHGL
ncbi:MAG TPA: hypothetical protein VIY86_03810, partial [Pirellulaceae bacterium]